MESGPQPGRGVNFEPATSRALARLFAGIATRLPLPAAKRVASAAGTVLWHLSHTARRNAERNLRVISDDSLSPQERRQIALNSFRNRCKRLVELAHLPKLGEDDLRDLVVVEGAQHILEARREGRGVMIVSNHFCNPELIGARLALEGIDLAVVARPVRYSAMPYVRQVHEAARFKVIEPTDLAGVVAHLRENGCVAILPELHRRRGAAKFSVLGLPIWIAEGAGAVAMRTGCAILPGLAVRGPDDRVRAVVEPPLENLYDGATSREAQVHAICAALAETLARNLRRHPDNWLWLHHQWADSPAMNEEAEPLASDPSSPIRD